VRQRRSRAPCGAAGANLCQGSWGVAPAGLPEPQLVRHQRRFWWPGHRHRWVAGDAGRTAVSASG
ncbi:unnamed protein product, partial [Effrenium voratum]